MKKSISLIIAAVMVMSTLCGCDLSAITETTGASNSKTTEVSGAKTISIPGTLVADNFSFNIVSADLVDSVTLNSGVDIQIDAEAGKQILILCVDAKNTSSDIRNVSFFTAYVDDKTVLPHTVLGKYNDRIMMNGAVDPGKTMCAYVMYQVPLSWENFEISYMDTLTGSVSGAVKFSKSDVI